MSEEKNDIEKLIDDMISNSDKLVTTLKPKLPDSVAESMVLFHQSHITNLKKIKKFLNT